MQPAHALREVDVLSPADVERRGFAPAVAGPTRDGKRFAGRAFAFRPMTQHILRAGHDPDRSTVLQLVSGFREELHCGSRIPHCGIALLQPQLNGREARQRKRDQRLLPALARGLDRELGGLHRRVETARVGLHACLGDQRARHEVDAAAAATVGTQRLGIGKGAIHVAQCDEALGAELAQIEGPLRRLCAAVSAADTTSVACACCPVRARSRADEIASTTEARGAVGIDVSIK
jgi:hypothetical protein